MNAQTTLQPFDLGGAVAGLRTVRAEIEAGTRLSGQTHLAGGATDLIDDECAALDEVRERLEHSIQSAICAMSGLSRDDIREVFQ